MARRLAGSVTTLHQDVMSNTFVEVVGVKRFHLYPPEMWSEVRRRRGTSGAGAEGVHVASGAAGDLSLTAGVDVGGQVALPLGLGVV